MSRFVFLALVALGGCISVDAARIGNRYPSRPANCAVEFEFGGMERVLALTRGGQHEQIGSLVAYDGPDDLTEKVKSAVVPDVCRIGGDRAIVLASTRNVGGRYNMGFAVLRNKTPDAV